MQTANLRYIVLIATLLVGSGLYAAFGEPRGVGAPRWPTDPGLYAVQGWSAGPLQDANGGFKTATLHGPAQQTATLSIFSNQAPKLYGAGAEVPFLGNGYAVAPASIDVMPGPDSGVHALVASRGTEQWLVAYAYGERRGLLGNGPQAWTLAVFDGVLGRPNDYYKVFLDARVDGRDASSGRELIALAGTLFPRIAAFYAS